MNKKAVLSDAQPVAPATAATAAERRGARAPGIAVAFAGALAAYLVAQVVPGLSALLVAIVLGAVWRNVAPVPAAFEPGLDFAAKHLLRAGIVLLGLGVSFPDLLDLGVGVLAIVLVSVVVTFSVTLWVGGLLKVSRPQRLLIAAGFSICGAAAVAGAQSVAKAKREEVATAIALVVVYGTLMIGLVPFLGRMLGMGDHELGVWIGASTHEVAQVVAAGGAVGGTALAAAVMVKLARVVTLAPMIAGISLVQRRREGKSAEAGAQRPPIVPLFVVGFLAAMALRSTGLLPAPLLDGASILQGVLLSAAMFALGLGINIRELVRVGPRPVLLGAVATATILVVSLAGTWWLAS